MRKLFTFLSVSADGYFEGPKHDLSWHNVDAEFNEYASTMLEETGMLLFGRRTYELMSGFWPYYTPPKGDKGDTNVAKQMNALPKVVFSKTLKTVDWDKDTTNIRLAKDDIGKEVLKLKQQPGKDLSAGGSNLCLSLLELGLVDEIRIMLTPVVIGDGTLLFDGLEDKLSLKLLKTRQFKSGNVLLYYQPT